jgi:hypothetical protein
MPIGVQVKISRKVVDGLIRKFGRMQNATEQTKLLAKAVQAAQRSFTPALRGVIKGSGSVESGALLNEVTSKVKSYKKDVTAWGGVGIRKKIQGRRQRIYIARQTSTKKLTNPDGKNRIPQFYFHLLDGGVDPHPHPVKVVNINGRKVAIRRPWIHPGFPARNLRAKARRRGAQAALSNFIRTYRTQIAKLTGPKVPGSES